MEIENLDALSNRIIHDHLRLSTDEEQKNDKHSAVVNLLKLEKSTE